MSGKPIATMSDVIEVPVIIVGGGGCGLTLSSFLSDYGVDHVLFERHNGTSLLPKAHYLNQRTMETFRQHGLGDEIMERSCPPRHMSQVAWATSLGGTDRLDRKVIHKFGCFGGDDGGPRAETYRYCSLRLRVFAELALSVVKARRRSCICQSTTTSIRANITKFGDEEKSRKSPFWPQRYRLCRRRG